MYYKVIKDNKVIDVLDKLIYLKWQPKHKIMVLCDINEAQAILSSDNETIWHEKTLYKIPIDGYEEVEVVPIDQFEYKKLKTLNLSTPEQIIDNFLLSLFESNIL